MWCIAERAGGGGGSVRGGRLPSACSSAYRLSLMGGIGAPGSHLSDDTRGFCLSFWPREREHSPAPTPVMCMKPNGCDRPPGAHLRTLPFLRTSLWCSISRPALISRAPRKRRRLHKHPVRCQSKPGRSLGCQSGFCWDFPAPGREDEARSYRRRSCCISISSTTIVKALRLWFHRGNRGNREGTQVGLIQLHRSQYYSNTT